MLMKKFRHFGLIFFAHCYPVRNMLDLFSRIFIGQMHIDLASLTSIKSLGSVVKFIIIFLSPIVARGGGAPWC
jgi:hypothetical protein